LPPGHCERERARTESDLRLPRHAAAVPEQRRLLVDDAGDDRNIHAPGDAEFSNAGPNRRQQLHGNAE
jgi:hypothetical protein